MSGKRDCTTSSRLVLDRLFVVALFSEKPVLKTQFAHRLFANFFSGTRRQLRSSQADDLSSLSSSSVIDCFAIRSLQTFASVVRPRARNRSQALSASANTKFSFHCLSVPFILLPGRPELCGSRWLVVCAHIMCTDAADDNGGAP